MPTVHDNSHTHTACYCMCSYTPMQELKYYTYPNHGCHYLLPSDVLNNVPTNIDIHILLLSLPQYYVDRGSGILYLFKPAADEVVYISYIDALPYLHTCTHNLSNVHTQGCVSVGKSVISMDKVSHVQVSGFTVDCSRQTAITATSGGYIYCMHDSIYCTTRFN